MRKKIFLILCRPPSIQQPSLEFIAGKAYTKSSCSNITIHIENTCKSVLENPYLKLLLMGDFPAQIGTA
jgi:hypothetical protein